MRSIIKQRQLKRTWNQFHVKVRSYVGRLRPISKNDNALQLFTLPKSIVQKQLCGKASNQSVNRFCLEKHPPILGKQYPRIKRSSEKFSQCYSPTSKPRKNRNDISKSLFWCSYHPWNTTSSYQFRGFRGLWIQHKLSQCTFQHCELIRDIFLFLKFTNIKCIISYYFGKKEHTFIGEVVQICQ